MVIRGDALTELKKLPNESVDCVVTSPPYWGLRNYGIAGQGGLEPSMRYLTVPGSRNHHAGLWSEEMGIEKSPRWCMVVQRIVRGAVHATNCICSS